MGEDFRKEHMVDKVEGWRGGGRYWKTLLCLSDGGVRSISLSHHVCRFEL